MYDVANFVLLGAMLAAAVGVFVRLPIFGGKKRIALGALALLLVLGIPLAGTLQTDKDRQKLDLRTTSKHDTYDDVYAHPEAYLVFDPRPVKNCGGSCLDLSGSIQNTSSYAIKDPKIRCDVNGESDRRLHRKEVTLTKRIAGKSTVRFADLSLGIIDQQSAGANCTITDADIAQGELSEHR